METSEEWVTRLETNPYGLRILTLHMAFQLAGDQASSGWYIAPYALKWTVGRAASPDRRYHVTCSGEPITFETVHAAFEFLTDMLGLHPTKIDTRLPTPEKPRG
ncbi:MAG: hypothetical protein ACXW2A_17255 [Burkholderiales bacterium]